MPARFYESDIQVEHLLRNNMVAGVEITEDRSQITVTFTSGRSMRARTTHDLTVIADTVWSVNPPVRA